MNLISFAVQNYRSITETEKLPVSNYTILIGPNNEGKSNMLRALVITLRILKRLGKPSIGLSTKYISRRLHEIYDWERDFPVSLQGTKLDGKSIFTLELELSSQEIEEFKLEVKSNLNGTLPIQIQMDKENYIFKVVKRGPGAKTLSKKSQIIAGFISRKLECVHIPAVRTAKSAKNVVDNILNVELQNVEENEEFKKALAEIAKIQQPVLDRMSSSIKTTLSEFLPNVKDVKVSISEEERYQALRKSCEITIDDGTPTKLEYKGDGIQSLAALSLMRHSYARVATGRHLILAIEEPESHLHPRAVHQLKQVIADISKQSQVIITTHCPVFVDRINLRANIIVSRNKASPAKNIKDIRNILGVKAADNLQHAELVLVVEGEDDKVALQALLCDASETCKIAITHGTLSLDSLLGGSNLSYKISQLTDAMCNYYCFLDNDSCAQKAFEKAKNENLLTPADVTFAICAGTIESEMEDLYNPDIYSGMLLNGYGISIDSPKFKGKKKWTLRMQEVFRHQGKQWNDGVEHEIKLKIAHIVADEPKSALNTYQRPSFEALVKALENKLAKK